MVTVLIQTPVLRSYSSTKLDVKVSEVLIEASHYLCEAVLGVVTNQPSPLLPT
jgi:hypothetical protein